MALKWGIASAGLISHDFLNAMGKIKEDHHHVVAIAARDLNRAQEYAERFDIPKAYGSYQELAEDPDVEIVYIGNLNHQHLDTALLMLKYGKHVLVEKPLALNEKQARKLLSYAESKNLFAMEAIWTRFFPSYKYVRNQIKNGALGEILTVEAELGLDLRKIDRLTKKELGGGTVLDLGVYTIQACQWALQLKPKSVKATGKLNDDGVDVEMQAEISYGDNKFARIKTSSLETLKNQARIIGTKGEITIHQIFCSTAITDVDGTEKSWPLPEAKFDFNFPNSCGLRYEAEEVYECLRQGKTQHESITHEESYTIAQIQDSIRKQIGTHFPEDDLNYD